MAYQNYLVLKIREANIFHDFAAPKRKIFVFRQDFTALIFWALLATLIASLFFYTVFMGLTVSQNYALSNLKSKLVQLETKNQEMELRLSQSQSFQNLAGIASALNLVEVRQVDYIKITASNLALNEALAN